MWCTSTVTRVNYQSKRLSGERGCDVPLPHTPLLTYSETARPADTDHATPVPASPRLFAVAAHHGR